MSELPKARLEQWETEAEGETLMPGWLVVTLVTLIVLSIAAVVQGLVQYGATRESYFDRDKRKGKRV